jgi:hypothetical protein
MEIDYYSNNCEKTFDITIEEIMEIQRQKHIKDLKDFKNILENKVEPIFKGNEEEEVVREWVNSHLELVYDYIEQNYEEEICGTGFNHR